MSERAAGRLVGTPTGFDDVDRLLGGLKPGQLVILAARPAMGKSALAGAIAHRNARNDRPVAVFSLEMAAGEVMDRLVALEAGIPLGEVTSGRPKYPSYVEAALESIRQWPMHVDDTPALTVQDVRRRCRSLFRRQPLALIVVDYLQLMSSEGETRNVAVESISRGLKALAKELGVPVLALAQLSRALEARPDKRPMLSDLRDSGGIEQDADVVLMLHREEVFRSDPGEWRGLAELLVRKNRQGPTGEIRLSWRGSHAAFDQHDGARWPETRVSSPRRRAFEE
jgi:replicative DNA helicase